MNPAISIKNLTKYYRKLKALDNVSFEVKEGEFFGFLGPNGAGKTTTIKVLTGLANYKLGSVQVFGHDVVRDYRETRKRIGLVPQEFNFDPFLSAEQILRFEGGYFGLGFREARDRARELLDFFDLTAKRKDGYRRLSGGMKRRLLVARALMHKPKILILDEPTAGIDLELRYLLWEFLKRINEEGVTLFLTTHYIEEAEKLCSRIGVIHEGKMVAVNTTEELVRKISGELVELKMQVPLESIPEEIKNVPMAVEENGKSLKFEDKPDALNQVLKALYSRGLKIEKIDVLRPRLEDAFLKLTGKSKS